MSQDLRRERAGASYETIAGATAYIAKLEAEVDKLQHDLMGYQVSDGYEKGYEHGSGTAEKYHERAMQLEAENEELRMKVRKANARWAEYFLNDIMNTKLDDGLPVIEYLRIARPKLIADFRSALFGSNV